MIISKCKNCGGSFWESEQGSRDEDLCDYCEDLAKSDANPFPAALMGRLCWLPAAWASGRPPIPQARAHHFLERTEGGYCLHAAGCEQKQHPISGPLLDGQRIAFIAYRLLGTHMLDVCADYHDLHTDPSPSANNFTVSDAPFELGESYLAIKVLVENGNAGQRLEVGSYDVSASWWSSKIYAFQFRLDTEGRGYFEPVINSDFVIAHCDKSGRIETTVSIDLIPHGSIILATGVGSAIAAAIDANAQLVDAEPHIPEMRNFAEMEDRLRCLNEWQARTFPHDRWQYHYITELAG
ncbi:hypothetical protein FS815_25725 [Agrobacterium vitis]|uniref:hypothetical protein n=1 Tax=Allorhizobium ampelinum TaxID=3025782 RepID=UPI001F1FD2D6|nr:hypothetical protein [Allorhizobium ampelinum]MCF1450191.1 hypothetical protein [Allorhizobium ampelinum]